MSYSPIAQTSEAFIARLRAVQAERASGALLDCQGCGEDADEESVELFGEATCLRCQGRCDE